MGNESDTSQKTEQASEPSGISDAMKMFVKEQAKSKEPPKETEETHQPTEESSEKEPEEELKNLEEGKKEETPAAKLSEPVTLMVNGEEVVVDDLAKLKTYAQQGYHYSQEMAKLKQSSQMVQDIMTAMKEGRLAINPSKVEPSAKEEALEEDLDEIDDPELAKERKARLELQKDYGKLKNDFGMLNKMVVTSMIESVHTQMKKEIDSLKKEKYPLADEDRIWSLLAEKDQTTQRPKYNVEQAVKLSSEEMTTKFKKFTNENPDIQKKSMEEKQAIIAEYLKKQEEGNEAPVSSPSPKPAAKASDLKGEKEGIQDMSDAMKKFSKWFESNKKAGQKL